MPKTIYFVAGEASGDNHGAALMRSLRELSLDWRLLGRGGPRMQALADAPFYNWIDRAGVLGLWEVVKSYGFFRQQFDETLREIAEERPDAVVLIDYPGFNLRLARTLRAQKSPRPKIFYYISPQVWAWNRGRIKQMARWVDLMLCIFPFEAELYNRSGLRTIFVGHPMIDRLGGERSDQPRDRDLVALFPGSRRREVRKIFPVMLEMMRKLRQANPQLRYEIAAASPQLAQEMQEILERDEASSRSAKIRVGAAAAIMQRATAGVVASGSATLEAAFFRLPFVLVYKVSWLTYLAARLVVRVEFLGMPNVLAQSAVVPEFIQHRARPAALARAVTRLLDEPVARERMVAKLDEVIASLGETGASNRAGAEIVKELQKT